jgi:hypothetical protein
MDENKPKIIIDEDWKSQVEREREQLRGQETGTAPAADAAAASSAAPEVGHDTKSARDYSNDIELPPPSLAMLVSTLATQAIAGLGQLPDPEIGQPIVRPKFAKYHIDLLAILQEKTKGNLTGEEAQMLEGALHELRMIYVQVVK